MFALPYAHFLRLYALFNKLGKILSPVLSKIILDLPHFPTAWATWQPENMGKRALGFDYYVTIYDLFVCARLREIVQLWMLKTAYLLSAGLSMVLKQKLKLKCTKTKNFLAQMSCLAASSHYDSALNSVEIAQSEVRQAVVPYLTLGRKMVLHKAYSLKKWVYGILWSRSLVKQYALRTAAGDLKLL